MSCRFIYRLFAVGRFEIIKIVRLILSVSATFRCFDCFVPLTVSSLRSITPSNRLHTEILLIVFVLVLLWRFQIKMLYRIVTKWFFGANRVALSPNDILNCLLGHFGSLLTSIVSPTQKTDSTTLSFRCKHRNAHFGGGAKHGKTQTLKIG